MPTSKLAKCDDGTTGTCTSGSGFGDSTAEVHIRYHQDGWDGRNGGPDKGSDRGKGG